MDVRQTLVCLAAREARRRNRLKPILLFTVYPFRNRSKFKDLLASVVAEQQKVNNLQILPLNLAHVLELEKLPFHHKDPFDRLLIAQASAEKMILVSSDGKFAAYSVNVLW